MSYIDGFIVPIPKNKLEDYKKFAELGATVWREYGALEYKEWVADDVKPGKLTSFPQSVDLQPDEVVGFSWIVYESRAHRDAVNEKVMKDPRMKNGSIDLAIRWQTHDLWRFRAAHGPMTCAFPGAAARLPSSRSPAPSPIKTGNRRCDSRLGTPRK